MKFKGAIFDLDGTLFDSMSVWTDIDCAFLKKRGIEMPEDYIRMITPMGFNQAAAYTIDRFGLTESPEEIMAEWDEMSEYIYRTQVRTKPYVKEYLETLEQRGVKLAVATAAYENLYMPALINNGILEFFDVITSVKEVKRGKGFPDVYIRAAEKMGLEPEECVVFEDIYAGIKGAKDGGFYAVAVEEPCSAHELSIIKEKCDMYIDGFDKAPIEIFTLKNAEKD